MSTQNRPLPFSPYPAIPPGGSVTTSGYTCVRDQRTRAEWRRIDLIDSCDRVHGDFRQAVLCRLEHSASLRVNDADRRRLIFSGHASHFDREGGDWILMWDAGSDYSYTNGRIQSSAELKQQEERYLERLMLPLTRRKVYWTIQDAIARVREDLERHPPQPLDVCIYTPTAEEVAAQHEICEKAADTITEADRDRMRAIFDAQRKRGAWFDTTPEEVARMIAAGELAPFKAPKPIASRKPARVAKRRKAA